MKRLLECLYSFYVQHYERLLLWELTFIKLDPPVGHTLEAPHLYQGGTTDSAMFCLLHFQQTPSGPPSLIGRFLQEADVSHSDHRASTTEAK